MSTRQRALSARAASAWLVALASLALAVAGLQGAFAPPAGAAATSVITTIAGTGTNGNSPDGTPATSALLGQPFGVTTDGFGDTVFTDFSSGLVRIIAASTCSTSCPYGVAPTVAGYIYTIAGGGSSSPTSTAMPARNAAISFPSAVAVEATGDVVIDDGGGSIDLLEGHGCASSCPFGLTTESIGQIVKIAGGGQGTPSATPQPGTSVSLASPSGVAVDSRGDVLEVEYSGYGYGGDGAVLFLAASDCSAGCPFGVPAGSAADDLVLLGGTGGNPPSTTPQPVSSVFLGYLNNDAITPRGDLVLTDTRGEGGSGAVELLAGSACASSCPYGAPPFAAGDLVIVAGGGTQALQGTSPAVTSTSALGWQIQDPAGIAVDPSGNLAVVDRNASEVVLVAAVSCSAYCPLGLPSTVAGNAYLAIGTGAQGYSGDGGPPAAAELSYPQMVSFAPGETLLVSDAGNRVIREVTTPAAPPPPPPPPPALNTQGYRLVGQDGGVFAFGDARFLGSLPETRVTPVATVVGMVGTASGDGYWLVGADGGVFAFGDARFLGSLPQRGIVPSAPMVGMAATPDGTGYWLVGSDGSVYSFGAAASLGSEAGHAPSAPIVGIAATADGTGYWLVGSDGSVYDFGSAGQFGSLPQLPDRPVAPIVGMAATPDGKGYWLVGSDGGVFAFGDAPFDGSIISASIDPIAPITGIAGTRDGKGYRLDGADGGVFAFGDAEFLGSLPALHLLPYAPISGASTRVRQVRP